MDYAKHRVSLSPVQRAILAAGAAAISFVDPFRGDMIACLGETTGTDALSYCHQKMLATSEGSRILARKPRISSSTIDFSALRRLPQGTLGRIYCDFLDVNVSSFDLTPLDSIRFDLIQFDSIRAHLSVFIFHFPCFATRIIRNENCYCIAH